MSVRERDPERTTCTFVSAIKQITPSYQRRILIYLAKNQGRKFTNIQIAHALEEDRSNIWRFLNAIIEESGEGSMINKLVEEGEVFYTWREPQITVDGFKMSEILKILEDLEKAKEDFETKGREGKA